jgi:ABC-type glycerol-3-phosphate transport system substrate-binding protein
MEERKMSKFKNVSFGISLVMLVILVVALAACSSAPAPQAAAPTPEPAQEEEATTEEMADEEEAAPEGEEIVISHWYHQYGEEGTFEAAQRYAAEYSEQTPGVTVEVNWVPGDYFAALNAALLTEDAPDVFELQTAAAALDSGRVKGLYLGNDMGSSSYLRGASLPGHH